MEGSEKVTKDAVEAERKRILEIVEAMIYERQSLRPEKNKHLDKLFNRIKQKVQEVKE